MVTAPAQPSVAVGVKVTIAVQAPAPVVVEIFAITGITGAVTSFTVIVCEQVAVRPAASVARYVLVITYLLTQVCALITSLTWVTTTPGQLSVAVTAVVLTAGTEPAQPTVTFAGQVMDGACASVTITLKVQVAIFPDASVAVTVTGVDPFEKELPEAGSVVTVTPTQLSVATGAGNVTIAAH